MEYLTLELKERLEASLKTSQERLRENNQYSNPVAHHYLKGKVEATKEALEIFKEVVDYHEELEEDDDWDLDEDGFAQMA
jgi:adenylate kinase family enzyme